MNSDCIKVKIEGKNVNNYIKWLISRKISIIKLNIIKHNELEVIIHNKDRKLLENYSKTYKITIIEKYGKLRLFDKLKNNIIILSCLVLSIIFLYQLSNIIFSVDIMYNNKDIINIINKELDKYNIKKYQRKKSYKYLEQVKENILKDNKDIIEWIEIEENGTKYIIRIVERKKEIKEKEYQYQSIIAKKDAIIISINASSGEKVQDINNYVRKGNIIISGIMTKPDGSNIYTKAIGTILGEVWYKIDIEYPFYYQEEKVTGKTKKVISLNFLNKNIPLFPYKKYKQFKSYSNIILENNFIPFKLLNEVLYEVNIIEEIYTEEEAIIKAIEEAEKKLKSKNSMIKDIKEVKILNKQNLNSKIKLTLFISAIEDITEIKEEVPIKISEQIN